MRKPLHKRRLYVDLPGARSWSGGDDGNYITIVDDEDEDWLRDRGYRDGLCGVCTGIENFYPDAWDLIRLTPLYCRLGETTAAQRRLFRSFNRRLR